MKALLSVAAGGPETLQLHDAPKPTPGRGEVLLRVAACGINYPDVLIIEDRYQYKPERPFAPGAEVSGVIEAVGEGVDALEPGYRVAALLGWGGLAEFVVVHAGRCVKIPDTMPFPEAAAFLMTYGTSWHALKDRAQLKAGETVLVLGAAGGVGTAAIELAKAAGARVVAAVSSEEKLAFCRSLGADDGVVYPAGPLDRDASKALAGAFKQACGGDGADVIYDAVGGGYAEPALRSVAWAGRYLVVGFPAGIPSIPLNLTLLKACQIIGVFWGAHTAREPDKHAANMADLARLFAEGRIRPRVTETFPLERAGEAIRALAERRASGKVVVTIEG
jgi:NADPH2:quinone reductase